MTLSLFCILRPNVVKVICGHFVFESEGRKLIKCVISRLLFMIVIKIKNKNTLNFVLLLLYFYLMCKKAGF